MSRHVFFTVGEEKACGSPIHCLDISKEELSTDVRKHNYDLPEKCLYYTCGSYLLTDPNDGTLVLTKSLPPPATPMAEPDATYRCFKPGYGIASDGFVAIREGNGVEFWTGDGTRCIYTSVFRECRQILFLPPTNQEINLMAEWLSRRVPELELLREVWRLIAEWLTDV
jgi:hypothetical protein